MRSDGCEAETILSFDICCETKIRFVFKPTEQRVFENFIITTISQKSPRRNIYREKI
jgi:hypothetical protein